MVYNLYNKYIYIHIWCIWRVLSKFSAVFCVTKRQSYIFHHQHLQYTILMWSCVSATERMNTFEFPVSYCRSHHYKIGSNMMTSSNGNIFRVTGHLCGEFTGPGEIPTQRPVTRSFDVYFDLRLNKRLHKQPWGWWFETPSWSLWRQCNGLDTRIWDMVLGRGTDSPICIMEKNI